MTRALIVALTLILCASAARAGQQLQGQQLQGQQLQGQQLQGQQLQGTSASGAPVTPNEPPLQHRYAGWYTGGLRPLGEAQLVQGQLVVPDRSGRLLAGSALVGAYLPADQGGAQVWTQIRSVSADPTFSDGSTLLYAVDLIASDGTRTPLCRADVNGVAAAIPIAAEFNARGDRVESTVHFTFGCTAGVIAKCYRWGYRPWLQADAGAPGQSFAQLHWACTRMARADYCGDGQTGTFDGTLINIWDRAPAPGPFQDRGAPPPEFLFEAGWSTRGAVCLSKQRWVTLPPEIASRCPDRLVAPGAATSSGTVCDTEVEALGFDSTTQLFNESKANVR